LLVLLLLAGCEGGLVTGTLIFEGEHRFRAGERLPGELFVRAGQVAIEEGSAVDGSVYLLGGALALDGAVGGDIVLLGGRLALGSAASVAGDLRLAGGELATPNEAAVAGEIIVATGAALPLGELGQLRAADDWLRLLSGALLLAGVGGLVMRGRAAPVVRLGEAAVDHALVSGALGLLLGLVLPALLVMMSFTLFLLPLVVVVGLLALAMAALGQVALGYQLGDWLARRLGRPLSPPWATFGGTLLLLALFAVPYLGQGLSLLAVVLALGAALLTRFGTRPYVPDGDESEADPAPYARPGAEQDL
jgi:hypothetical protein